jgi:hypothetical protein
MSRSRKKIRPDVGVVSPEMSRNSVVLPAPLGPMIERNSPTRIATSTRSTAMRLPKARVRRSVRNSAVAGIRADSTPPFGVSRRGGIVVSALDDDAVRRELALPCPV